MMSGFVSSLFRRRLYFAAVARGQRAPCPQVDAVGNKADRRVAHCRVDSPAMSAASGRPNLAVGATRFAKQRVTCLSSRLAHCDAVVLWQRLVRLRVDVSALGVGLPFGA